MKKHFLNPVLLSVIMLSFVASCHRELTSHEIKMIHDDVLTLDSHMDTPLWTMMKGVDLGVRTDPREALRKVDFIRMQEGGLDGAFFAVFVPQMERTPEGYERARLRCEKLLDSVYAAINRHPDKVELALEARDLQRISTKGKRAIYIGMENGYPVGKDLSMLSRFHNMGVKYITLCHMGNNDICDSSYDIDGPEHDGLSKFGREVVAEMNRLGMIIDVSHMSDKAFFDLLACSQAPVIASHSNARALCDHPRNMSDEMLRELAGKGGVIQLCLVSDFVTQAESYPERDSALQLIEDKWANTHEINDSTHYYYELDMFALDTIFPSALASVSQFVDHVDHVVNLIGIDHVGFGSDFDGGAGLSDCNDVSELFAITGEMLRRGYTRSDLEKFWGGNLLRVMKEIESLASL